MVIQFIEAEVEHQLWLDLDYYGLSPEWVERLVAQVDLLNHHLQS